MSSGQYGLKRDVPGKIGDLYLIELRDYDPDDVAGEVQEGTAAAPAYLYGKVGASGMLAQSLLLGTLTQLAFRMPQTKSIWVAATVVCPEPV